MEQEMMICPEQRDSKSRAVHYCLAIFLLAIVYLHLYGLISLSAQVNCLILMISDVLLFAVTFVCALLSGAKPNLLAILSLLLGVVSAMCAYLNGAFFDTQVIYFFVLILSYGLFVLALFDNHSHSFSGFTFFLDAIKAVFVYPFISFASIFTLFFHGRKTRSKDAVKKILSALIGVGAAVVLGVAVILILSYDPKFRDLFRIEIDWDDLPIIILRVFLTVPVCALIFGAFRSSEDKRLPNMSTKKTAETLREKIRRVPPVVFLIPTVTLLVIYGLFFFTQWDVYMSAFSGVLPASYTYAEYARSGFFELCVVAFINAAFCTAYQVFAKDTLTELRKIANTLLALATLVLIATALSKMILYIRSYDLTVLRLFTSVVMIVIAIGFLLSILAQWIKRVKVFPVLLTVVAALLLIAPFLNVRGRIAKYNVDAYIARAEQQVKPNKIDLYYLMFELDDAGVPDAIRLLESGKLSESDVKELYEILEERYRNLKELEPRYHTLASRRALNALEDFFDGIKN